MCPPIDANESVLLIGPTLSGRRRLFHQMLAGVPTTPVVIATRNTATSFRKSHQRMVDDSEERVITEQNTDSMTSLERAEARPREPIIIDCVTNVFDKSPTDTHATKYAQDPRNLTSIGTKFTEVISDQADEICMVGIETISPLLVYVDASQVFQFVHLIQQQTRGVGGSVVATIDPAVHDDAVVEQLVTSFDCVIRTGRDPDDGQEFCVRRPERTEWRPV